jgi:hypothetical protein
VIVVSDAGPLIHLGAGAWSSFIVSGLTYSSRKPVFREVTVTGAGMPGAEAVKAAGWLTIASPSNADLVNALLASGLHRGESEAIALAVERRAERLLIDERQGRLTAEGMGIAVIGSIGILVAAKARREVERIAPRLADLRASGLWMSDALVARVLAGTGEDPG